MKPNPHRLDPGVYPYHFDIAARFSDVDPLWHLNNVRLMEVNTGQEGAAPLPAALVEVLRKKLLPEPAR